VAALLEDKEALLLMIRILNPTPMAPLIRLLPWISLIWTIQISLEVEETLMDHRANLLEVEELSTFQQNFIKY
jgi:hypothetical protein